ncbi:hypothetical protein [Pseudopelagicola sp. nBUS_19]|uniref:hypothetical protein n=1 Tax=Pseudopelagicola sp. nBUS_19 TaxID=3395316 RepID=UPI003EBB6154
MKVFRRLFACDTPIAASRVEIDKCEAMTTEIKRIARFFGADLAAITQMDERWLYSARVDVRDFSETENALPKGLTSVIVLGHQMDEELVAT